MYYLKIECLFFLSRLSFEMKKTEELKSVKIVLNQYFISDNQMCFTVKVATEVWH